MWRRRFYIAIVSMQYIKLELVMGNAQLAPPAHTPAPGAIRPDSGRAHGAGYAAMGPYYGTGGSAAFHRAQARRGR